MANIILIGGSNIDYIGTSNERLVKEVSNLGKINISFGGVMRNTCENLARIGNKCVFLTAIGDDVFGIKLKEELKDLGVDLYTPTSKYPTSSYLAINGNNHDMAMAICDNRIMEDLNPSFIEEHKDLINKAEYIVIDSNLSEETIDYLFKNFKDKKFICEAISPQRVIRYSEHLDEIYLLKCNIHEAQALMNIDLVEKDLVGGLLAKGIKNVVVSNRANDIYYGNNFRDIGKVNVEEIKEFVNTTGCGDALFSGIIDKFTQGEKLKDAVWFGNELSRITLMSEGATSKEVSKFRYEHK